jgi:hypothetical protein
MGAAPPPRPPLAPTDDRGGLSEPIAGEGAISIDDCST